MFPQDFLLKICLCFATEPACCGQSLADATVAGGRVQHGQGAETSELAPKLQDSFKGSQF